MDYCWLLCGTDKDRSGNLKLDRTQKVPNLLCIGNHQQTLISLRLDGIRCVARLIKILMLGTPTVKIDNNQHIEQACSTNRNISIDEWKMKKKLDIRTQR